MPPKLTIHAAGAAEAHVNATDAANRATAATAPGSATPGSAAAPPARPPGPENEGSAASGAEPPGETALPENGSQTGSAPAGEPVR